MLMQPRGLQLQKWGWTLFLCSQMTLQMHPVLQYYKPLTQQFNPSSRAESALKCAKDTIKAGHLCPPYQDPLTAHCTLGLGLHFLRGLRSRFTGGGSRSEGSSGKGLVSFSVLTTGKVNVAEPGLMGM